MADTAVVGILKTMLTMDTASYEAGAKRVPAVNAKIERSIKGVGDQVKKLTPQAERMAKAFSGDKLLYSANSLTSAVTKLGGAQKLTANEQARVNKTLGDALTKYKALGQQAPAALVALERQTRKTADAKSFLTGKMVALTAAGGVMAAQFAGQLLRSVVNLGREAIETAGRFVDLSNQTGLSTTTLQRMDAVAGQTGGTLEGLANAAFKLGDRISGGGESVREAVSALGLDFEKLRQQRIDQQFEGTIIALGKMKDATARNEAAVELFGIRLAKTALGAAADYQKIADATKLSTEEQLLQLDVVGDRLDQLARDSKTAFRSVIADLAFFADELGRIGKLDLLKTFFVAGMRTPDALAFMAQQQAKADLEKKRKAEQAAAATTTATKAEIDYIAALKEAEGELAKLDETERKQVAAAQQMGAEQEVLTDLLVKFGVSGKHAEVALSLLNDTTKQASKDQKESAREAEAAANAWRHLLEQYTGFTERTHALDLTKAVNTGQLQLAKRTEEELRRIMQVLLDSKPAWETWSATAVAEIKKALAAVQTTRQMLKAFHKELLDLERPDPSAPVPMIDQSFAQFGVESDLARGEDVTSAMATREAAAREHAKALRDIDISRSDAAIKQAEREGAKRIQILTLESLLAQKVRDADLKDAQDAFIERTQGLKRETEAGEAEYQRRLQEYQNHLAQINEAFGQAQAEREAEMRRESSFWLRELKGIVEGGARDIARSATSGLFTLMTGFGQGDDSAKQRAKDAKEYYEQLKKSGKASAEAITRAFIDMHAAQREAQSGFSDRFGRWLKGLLSQFGSWIDQMVGAFVRELLGGFMKALAASTLGRGISNWISKTLGVPIGGAGVMDLGGGLLGKIPGLSGLLGGGLATAGFSTAAGGTLAASALAGGGLMTAAGAVPVAIASQGVSAGLAAGGAGGAAAAGGGGLGAAVAGLATNPITIGIAAAIGGALLLKKLNFFDNSPGALSRRVYQNVTGKPAHFNTGGFVPPNSVVPAVLHGGTMGEFVMPVQKMLAAQTTGGGSTVINFHVDTPDAEGFDRLFDTKIIPRLKRELVAPRHGILPMIQRKVLS